MNEEAKALGHCPAKEQYVALCRYLRERRTEMLEHLIKYIKMQITCMYTCERLHLLLILIIKMENRVKSDQSERIRSSIFI